MLFFRFIAIVFVVLFFINSLFLNQIYSAENTVDECFESRENTSLLYREKIESGKDNVKCSEKTGAVLWYGDPFWNTADMADGKINEKVKRVMRPRGDSLMYMPCSSCHDGVTVPFPNGNEPRELTFHQEVFQENLEMTHGRGRIWCLDCHTPTNRETLIGNFGKEISFDKSYELCGRCHGSIYKDWEDGIHGKRIGMWNEQDKKRWWNCTECHDPHSVQVNAFAPLEPEAAPVKPEGLSEH